MQECKNNVVLFKKKIDVIGKAKLNKDYILKQVNDLPEGEITSFFMVAKIGDDAYRGWKSTSKFELLGVIEDAKCDIQTGAYE